MLAFGTDTFGTLLWPVPGPDAPAPAPVQAPPTFLRSIMPALDLAFGLSDLSDVSEDLGALIVRLHGVDAQALAQTAP